MSLQVLTKNPKSCCPAPLECVGNFFIVRRGTIWESYVPVKGTFTFDGSQNTTTATIRIYLFDGKIITRSLLPGQSFVFTGDNIRRIEIYVPNGSSNITFRHCTQELLDSNCKWKDKCCPESLQCEAAATYNNIPLDEDFLLWESTIPVTGSITINPDAFSGGEINVIIKRFNKPDLTQKIKQGITLHTSDMKALIINIPSSVAEPPSISVELCLIDQVSEKEKC